MKEQSEKYEGELKEMQKKFELFLIKQSEDTFTKELEFEDRII